MNKVCLNVLVGIPGAGKTTYCHKILEYLSLTDSSVKAVHICFDDFIKFDATVDLENSSFKSKRKRLLELLEQLIKAIKEPVLTNSEQINSLLLEEFNSKIALDLSQTPSNYLVLIDDNMYYRSMRYQVFQIARRTTSGYLQTYFNVSLDNATSRNRKRVNPVPEEVIYRMFYKLEKPDANICKWEKNTVSFNNSSIDVQITLNIAMKCIEQPEELIYFNSKGPPVEQSLVHKVDLLLRKTVGEMIKQQKEILSSSEIKLYAEGLLCKRKLLLEDLRAGLVELDPEVLSAEQMITLLL